MIIMERRHGSAAGRAGRFVAVLLSLVLGVFGSAAVVSPAYAADTEAPVLETIPDQTYFTTSSSDRVAYPAPRATDDVDEYVAAVCTPARGSTFAVGVTTVTCTATDSAGNTGTTSFAVTLARLRFAYSPQSQGVAVGETFPALTLTATRDDGGPASSLEGLQVTLNLRRLVTFSAGGTRASATLDADGKASVPEPRAGTATGSAPLEVIVPGTTASAPVPFTAGFLRVTPGPAASIAITSPEVLPAGDDTPVFVEGYDQYGNARAEVDSYTVSITPEGTCTGWVCRADELGPHTLTATSGSLSTTAEVNVVPGTVASIKVSPSSGSIVAGADQAYIVRAYDRFGHAGDDVTGDSTFSISQDGSCAGASCTATKVGAYTVTATFRGFTDRAALTVTPAATASIKLSPGSGSIAAGGAQRYAVRAYDRYGNGGDDVTGAATLTISPDGSCSAGSCTATTAGPHTVTARVGTASDTASLTVTPAAAAQVSATAGNAQQETVRTPFGTRLAATVTDTYGNVVSGAPVTFTVTGPAAFGGTSSATVVTTAAGVATAPVLTTGSTNGSVTITATTGSASPATFLATVISPTSARADLAIAVTAPANVTRGGTASVTVKVTNNGPNAANTVTTGLVVGAGLTVTGSTGGTVRGSAVIDSTGSLASGASRTFTATVKVGSTGPRTVSLGAATVSLTRDPALANNVRAVTARVS